MPRVHSAKGSALILKKSLPLRPAGRSPSSRMAAPAPTIDREEAARGAIQSPGVGDECSHKPRSADHRWDRRKVSIGQAPRAAMMSRMKTHQRSKRDQDYWPEERGITRSSSA